MAAKNGSGGFDNRIIDQHKIYHWDCYWRIIWPESPRGRLKKRMGVIAK